MVTVVTKKAPIKRKERGLVNPNERRATMSGAFLATTERLELFSAQLRYPLFV
ncbi:hypothetical protein GP5015_911 [gamma proteobacterium HTCC5015]|nr:hypothetical protein GP5015_911 [gamma proteobacterium HTCC5015]